MRSVTYPGGGAAAPLCAGALTARFLLGAVKLARPVTWYPRVVLGVLPVGLDHLALREGADDGGVLLLLACPRLHVAGVALRAAVFLVSTTHRLQGATERRGRELNCLKFALVPLL